MTRRQVNKVSFIWPYLWTSILGKEPSSSSPPPPPDGHWNLRFSGAQLLCEEIKDQTGCKRADVTSTNSSFCLATEHLVERKQRTDTSNTPNTRWKTLTSDNLSCFCWSILMSWTLAFFSRWSIVLLAPLRPIRLLGPLGSASWFALNAGFSSSEKIWSKHHT